MSALDNILAAPKITHDLVQGTPPWDQFRLEHRGASEAAAALGLSKTVARNELLRMKHSGVAREFSEWVQTKVLDRGHELEALARPHVEAELGEDLYPVTCSRGSLSASCDGLTLDDATAFEHKQWAEELTAAVRAGTVPDEHMPQCQQIMLVTGAQRVKFVVSDGTPDKMVSTIVTPDRAWWERIAAGWEQFDADLAAYQPQLAAPVTIAAPVESLPAVLVNMRGSLTVESNLDAFGKALRAFINKIPVKPSTDQEFADTDAACKALKKTEEALAAEEGRALASMADVQTMRSLVAELATLARTTRLAREKMVEARKLEIRTEEVARGKAALAEFIASLNSTIGKPYMPASLSAVDFAGAIKGLRSLDSVRNAIDSQLATAKIAANQVANTIIKNMATLRELAKDHIFLFADTASIVLKPCDDCRALVENRIAAHKQAEAEKEAARREEIRKEEVARIEREQEAARQAELRREQQASEAAKAALPDTANERPASVPSSPLYAGLNNPGRNPSTGERDTAAPTLVSQAPAANSPTVVPIRGNPTLKLGDINARIAPLSIDAAGLAQLGFPHAGTDRAAKLFHEADFARMLDSMVAHLRTVAQQQLQAA